MTNMTSDEFTKFYDATDENSFGSLIALVDGVVGTFYECADTDLCTP
jgi:hypothetical protein